MATPSPSSAPAPVAAASPGPRRRVRIRRGLDLPLDGAPPATVEEGPSISSVALLGADAPGVRPRLQVEVGERVRLGQTLFVDRRRPEIGFTAPGAGVVAAIERGPRRSLESLVIQLDAPSAAAATAEPAVEFDVPDPASLSAAPRARVQATLLASGLWTHLCTRPFSRIPDPGSAPDAIFVTAMETDPLAASPASAIAERAADFALGVAALLRLTDGPVHVCVAPGDPAPVPDDARVRVTEFQGPHPAGLAGTHVHHLHPVDAARRVWHVGWPAVLDLGRLLATGRLPVERRVSLAGPAVRHPRLLRTRRGASTEDLVRGQLAEESCRVISGSVLSGRQASGRSAYLGALHTQLSVLPEQARGRRGWWVPGPAGRWRTAVGGAGPWTPALGGRRGAFVPLERLERVVPLDLPVTPLLRALLVGDADAAVELGALELAEEDLALVSFLCPGKIEYGALLRGVLDEIEKAAA